MTSGRRFVPEIRRHFPLADIISLKTMAGAVLRLRQPRVFRVRILTVEKMLSTGLTVRLCLHRHRLPQPGRSIRRSDADPAVLTGSPIRHRDQGTHFVLTLLIPPC